MATVTADVSTALRALSAGEIVAYPTETTYGLGVDATSAEAVAKLLLFKNRPPFKPFPILLPDVETLGRYVDPIPPEVQRLIGAYWPGPLTIVLPAHGLPKALANRTGGVGFRITSHPLAGQLVREFNRCITTTSANPPGRKAAQSATEVARYFQGVDLCVLDGGTTAGGAASTVIEFSEEEPPTLHREGPVSWKQIKALLRKKPRKTPPRA